MTHEWKVGDRAKVVSRYAHGMDFGGMDLGRTFTVTAIDDLDGLGVYLDGTLPDGTIIGNKTVDRCKPVFRVQAPSRPTPELYHELRTAHGPSRYTTGRDVFRGWPGNTQERDAFDVLLGGMGKSA